MRWKYLPNMITLMRILLIGPTCYCIAQHHFLHAFSFLILAGISDGLDGFLARRFSWQTRLGSILDPAADKLMIISCFSTLAYIKAIPLWLLWIILLKDIVIVSGALIYHYWIAPYEFSAILLSKINTFLQIFFVLVAVAKLQFDQLPNSIVYGLMYGMMFTTLGSMLNYIWVWSLKAYHHLHGYHD